MNKQPLISVIVLNYNPDFEKLCATLKSALLQKDINFEIIIADDGSKNNLEKEIKNLFKEYDFSNYKLVLREKNVGTVQNLYDAVKASCGKYIKPISPADCFYNETTLNTVLSYMDENKSDVLFGDMVYYEKSKEVNVFNIKTPWCDEIYLQENYNPKKILKHQMSYYENISGAAVFYRRERIIEGLEFILGTVRYAEDAMLQYFATKGERISYLPQFVVWYEYGSGISTSQGRSNRLVTDFYEFYKLLKTKFPKNSIIKRNLLKWFSVSKDKKLLNLFLKSIGFDYIFFYLKRLNRKKKYSCSGYDITYLNDWFSKREE